MNSETVVKLLTHVIEKLVPSNFMSSIFKPIMLQLFELLRSLVAKYLPMSKPLPFRIVM